ncbi:thioredoxin family protein [uncultured Alcanivorax sp.]|jgi:thiol:disulfide interchange protein DsbD|uniref:protein-disulfide reductase DsbD family protein n=1 Tax=uncultured Alcanivorax sp. TaxID=191215 RepID=UPI002582D5E1|nr:thioredoxin family protein [uncultured Alcanivorax sp.]
MSLWQYLLLATAAGVLLNLTPCVLPALPIKLRSIGRVVGDGAGRRLLAGGALLGGTLTFFGALAVATAWLNWTWGALFHSASFRLTLAAVLAGLGVWSLAGRGFQPPQWAYRMRGSGYAEPYFAGLLAAVLSTPCTGPFLGGVLAFALTQSPAAIVAIFLAVGVGLALPYLILLVRPGLIARIPRGGAWLLRIQQFLGLVLLAGAVFFAATVLPGNLGPLLWTAWATVLTFWLLRTLWDGPDLRARLVPALVLAGTVATALALWPQPDRAGTDTLAWRPLTMQALADARAARQPVLIEFTADWCINCKVLEQTVYRDRRVVEAARAANALTLRADLTRPDERLQRYLREFGGAGLPFAVVLDGNGKPVKRLPDLFMADTLASTLHNATEE